MDQTSEAKKYNESREPQSPTDIREKAYALGFEISRRAAAQNSFSELCLYLVNDLRVFIEFDRCFIAAHMGGVSRVVATNHQPSPEAKSETFERMNELATGIKTLEKGMLLSCADADCDFGSFGIDDDVKSAVRSYTNFSGCSYLVCIPLINNGQTVFHIVCEFFGDRAPHRLPVVALIEAGPLLASILLERWVLERKPSLAKLFLTDREPRKWFPIKDRRLWIICVTGLLLLLYVLFLFPVDYTVGGEASIVPWERKFAFCKIDGLIDKTLVKEGDRVKSGQTLALLDPREIHFRIARTEREIDIIARQIERLGREADKTPAKLGEKKIAELERQKKNEELKYYRWQSQFLSIKSPTNGIIMTKDVDSLAGKKMTAGEPFCEIAAPGELAAEVLAPDNKAVLVKPGQLMHVYLNNNPMMSYRLRVDEVAPSAEVMPRQGNVCRVKAQFPNAPHGVMVGMTGIGKIHTEETTLWSIIWENVVLRWNQLSLYF